LEVVGNKTPTYPAVLRGFQPPPREELYHEILPLGEVIRRASWGFQPPEPRSIGAKREELLSQQIVSLL